MQRLKSNLSFLFILTAIITLIIMSISCNDNPVGPGNEPPPGRRDYEWREYRIDFGGELLQLNNVWASSPTNVWGAAGITSSIYYSVVHFDGTTLRHYPIEAPGPNTTYVWGLDSTNIWLATAESDIWHYNGKNWYQQQKFYVEGYDQVIISKLWGTSEDNLYGVGFAQNYTTHDYVGVIIKYVNAVWEFLDIPNLRVGFGTIAKDPKTNNLFISALNSDNGFLEKLFVYNGKDLMEVYSEYSTDPAPVILGDELVILLDQVLYKYNYTFKNLEKYIDLTGTSLWGGITGRSINDFFAVAADGIGHYNGTSFETIYKTNLDHTRPFVLEKDAFFPGTDFNTRETVLIHAKLKEE